MDAQLPVVLTEMARGTFVRIETEQIPEGKLPSITSLIVPTPSSYNLSLLVGSRADEYFLKHITSL